MLDKSEQEMDRIQLNLGKIAETTRSIRSHMQADRDRHTNHDSVRINVEKSTYSTRNA